MDPLGSGGKTIQTLRPWAMCVLGVFGIDFSRTSPRQIACLRTALASRCGARGRGSSR